MRSKHKMWRNGPGGRWSSRITWYAEGEATEATGWDMPDNIRLELEDCERKVNLFPPTLEAAQQIWFMFKQGAPQDGQKIPFVADLLALLKSRVDTGSQEEATP